MSVTRPVKYTKAWVPDAIEELKSIFHVLEKENGSKAGFISLFALVKAKYAVLRDTPSKRALRRTTRRKWDTIAAGKATRQKNQDSPARRKLSRNRTLIIELQSPRQNDKLETVAELKLMPSGIYFYVIDHIDRSGHILRVREAVIIANLFVPDIPFASIMKRAGIPAIVTDEDGNYKVFDTLDERMNAREV